MLCVFPFQNGLDSVHRQELWDVIKNSGKTVILTTHNMEEVYSIILTTFRVVFLKRLIRMSDCLNSGRNFS